MSKLSSFVWSVADQLRGPFQQHEYGSVILPMTILRRLDAVCGALMRRRTGTSTTHAQLAWRIAGVMTAAILHTSTLTQAPGCYRGR